MKSIKEEEIMVLFYQVELNVMVTSKISYNEPTSIMPLRNLLASI